MLCINFLFHLKFISTASTYEKKVEEYLEFSQLNFILSNCVKNMIKTDAGNPVAFIIEFMYQEYPVMASLSHAHCDSDSFEAVKLNFHNYRDTLALKSKSDSSGEGEEQVYKAYATYMQEAYGPIVQREATRKK